MTIEHLADIDRLVNESLHMLSRYDELNAKILPLMEDYLIALRSRDKTPASLLRMDKQHEKELIDNYTTGIQQKIKGECRVLCIANSSYALIKNKLWISTIIYLSS